jgi:predicted amidohydrolase YtcJ
MSVAANRGLPDAAQGGTSDHFASSGSQVPGEERFKTRPLNDYENGGLQARATIFFGGPILTIDDERPVVEAMAVRDGKIIALGDRKSILQYHTARTRMVDLQGCALMPGFIDPHVHLAWSAFTTYRWVSVAPPIVGNRQEMISVVRAAAQRKRASEWVIACGYDSSKQPGDQPLNAAELDAISTTQPVFVLEQSWDVAYVNHKALEVAGITDNSSAATGSNYVRDASGKMTGEIRGATAFAALAKSFPAVTFEEKLHDCKAMVRSWAQQGCTTIYDAALGSLWGQEEVRLFLEMASDPTIPMRIRAALIPTDGLPYTAGIKPMHGNDRLYFAGIKFWSDGIAPGVIGAFDQPFMSGIENYQLNYADADLQSLMQAWHDAGWQLLVHANSSEAIEQTLRVYENLLAKTSRLDHRHRIEHCSFIDESQLSKAKALGVTITHLIGHVYWGNVLKDRIAGVKQSIVPLASDFEAGINVSVHSDSPATPVEPLHYVQTAVTRKMRGSEDVLVPAQRISIEKALKTVTIHPAYQCFLEDKVGSLQVGKLADLVVLDHNPYAVAPDEVAQIKVLETFLEGAPLSAELNTPS